MLGLDRAVDSLDEQRELIASEACSGIRAAQAGTNPGGDLDEERVAGGEGADPGK